MSKIRIQNFGPIKSGYQDNNGLMDIKKTTIFIGDQGSGKSTIAKLIATLMWIEKVLVRGNYNKEYFEKEGNFSNQFSNYHRLENYFVDGTEIEYQGDAYQIKYKNGRVSIENRGNATYSLPQIMYVPSERNFISYVKSPNELKLSSDSLKEFLTEFANAKNEMAEAVELPINDVKIEYDSVKDNLNIKGDNYKVNLTKASSGFQSLVPLYLVSNYLSKSVKKQSKKDKTVSSMSSREVKRFKDEVQEILLNDELSDEQKRVALSVLSAKFNKTAFINIVEEPEQNLFPTSQWKLLKSLLKFNNLNEGNKLIITTHSPYIINYLSLAVKADSVKSKIKFENLETELNAIVPLNSTVNSNNLNIYELDEKNGTIKLLENYKGLPSDENYLNLGLAESNKIFANLLDIEDRCQ